MSVDATVDAAVLEQMVNETIAQRQAGQEKEEQASDVAALVGAFKIHGKPLEKLPDDLYIPPDALQIFLEAFEGPLDLLLYLIRKNNLDLLEIPLTQITKQYLDYVEMMKVLRLELAAEYLVMAATLAEIKSRLLLPKPKSAYLEEESDPRAELIRRLQEYERFKKAAEALGALPEIGRDTYLGAGAEVEKPEVPKIPQVTLQELVTAFYEILKRADLVTHHRISRENLSVRERMSSILQRVSEQKFLPFEKCFNLKEGRSGVVVCFLAILELLKLGLLDIIQAELFGPIHLKAVSDSEALTDEQQERITTPD